MNDEKVLAPIRYFELDPRVNYHNFSEVAVEVVLDTDFVNTLVVEFEESPISISRLFENVKSIPDYERHLMYVRGFWVFKDLHDRVSHYLDEVGQSRYIGHTCLLLLVFRRIQEMNTAISNTEIREKEVEFGRFLKFLLRYRIPGKYVSEIEFRKGSTLQSFKHGDFILKRLLELIDEVFKDDLLGWMEFYGKYHSVDVGAVDSNTQTDYTNKQVRYMLIWLEAIFKQAVQSQSRRCLLYNQLFATAEILDFKEFKLRPHHENYKVERAKIIDRLRDRLRNMK